MFCPKCDSVIVPKEGVLVCLDCEYESENSEDIGNYIIKDEVKHTAKSRIEIVEKPADFEGITKEIREELRETYREAIGNASD